MKHQHACIGNPIVYNASIGSVLWVGFLTGFLLNLTGWLGNNFLLGKMWRALEGKLSYVAWRGTIWQEIFSLVPDFIYGFAIAWLCNFYNAKSAPNLSNWITTGIAISIVGGLTTYFALANSGFVPWELAFASFFLVIATKIPLAIFAGSMLLKKNSIRK